MTEIIGSHPGGSHAILKYAGRDATQAFLPIHASDTLLKHLLPEYVPSCCINNRLQLNRQHLGPAEKVEVGMSKSLTKPKKNPLKAELRAILNIRDFEVAASRRLPPRAFACMSREYPQKISLTSTVYKAGADDEYTAQWNRDSWKAIRFWPRILIPMATVDISTEVLNNKFSAPFFICPAGGPKLAHPEGETLLTKAAGKHGILHWVCNMAGCSQDEIMAVSKPGQNLYWQIYALNDLEVTAREVRRAVELGFMGFALTVDAVRSGKRERDTRAMVAEVVSS